MTTRECKGCDLCCYIPAVSEIGKPSQSRCPRASDCGGCGLYEIRPKVCRDLNCAWLTGAFGTIDDWPMKQGMAVIDRGKYYEDLDHRVALLLIDPRRHVPERIRKHTINRLHAAGWAIVFVDSSGCESLPVAYVNVSEPGIMPIVWSLEAGDLAVERCR